MLGGGDVFCPKVALHAHDVALRLGGNLCKGIVSMDPFQGDGSFRHISLCPLVGDAEGLLGEVGILHVVYVTVGCRSHYDVVAHRSGLDASGGATPAHHRRSVVELAFEYLVPADDLLALALEELLHAGGNVVLQLGGGAYAVLVHESELAHLRLAVGVFLPLVAGAFVAADVDVFAREEVGHFAQDVLEELHGLLAADIEHLLGDAPLGPYLIRLGLAALASEFGVGRQRGLHVAGQVDFGDDGDSAFCGVGDYVSDLVLGVVSAVTDAVVGCPVAADHSAVTEGSDLGEAGVLVYLDPPALVFGEVPVQAVELVDRHHVEHLLDFVQAEEVPAAVEHEAAVAEAGSVLDLAAGDLPFCLEVGSTFVDGQRQHLPYGLEGVKEAVVVICAHDGGLLAYADPVALCRYGLVLYEVKAFDLAALHGTGEPDRVCYRDGLAARKRQAVRELPYGTEAQGVHCRVAVDVDALEAQGTLCELYLLRGGNDLGGSHFGGVGANGKHKRQGDDYSFHKTMVSAILLSSAAVCSGRPQAGTSGLKGRREMTRQVTQALR